MPPRGYWGIKCHTGVLGRQMPHGGIGASNATLNLLGRCWQELTLGPTLGPTPSPWLTLLLVLGKNRVNQISC